MSYTCDYPGCGAEYTSAYAAAECGEQDRLEDANTRGWYARHNPNHRGI